MSFDEFFQFDGQLPPIDWGGFIDQVLSEESSEQEVSAWLYSDKPYSQGETWHVIPVKTIPIDRDGDGFAEGFKPDKADLRRVKGIAKEMRLTRLGNIHTHHINAESRRREGWRPGDFADATDYRITRIENHSQPSDVDLQYMRRFGQVVRGIICVEYWPATSRSDYTAEIYALRFHDQYGRTIAFRECEPASIRVCLP